jgi:hypothetical protein
MDFHVITPSGSYLIMRTAAGRVVQVWPVPLESLPGSRPVAASVQAN